MWYKASNGEMTKPEALDTESSRVYAYARKDFVEVPESGEEDHIIPAHWEWMECKIPKDVLAIFQQANENRDNVALLEGCILEISEYIYGE